MKKGKKLLIILYAIIVIGLGCLIYVVPQFKEAVTRTSVLEYGNLQVKDTVTCYFIRDEIVYSAGTSGSVNYYIEDKTQVRKGAKVLDISPGKVEVGGDEERPTEKLRQRLGTDAVKTDTYAVPIPSTVSYYVDGYENYFTPDNMRQLRYDNIKDISFEVQNLVRDDTLEGEPLYKLCRDQKWYMAAWVEAGNISKYTVESNVTVNLPLGDVKAKIIDIIEDGDKWLVLFQSNRYYEDLTNIRYASATVITSDYSGIIIDNASITTNDGKVGVYKKTKNGDYVFVPIKVLTTDGTQSLAEVSYYYDADGNRVNTVEIYDEILKRPKADQ